MHSRAFAMVSYLRPSRLARLTQIDYDREMAFIATRDGPDGGPETLGVVRSSTDPGNDRAEFAIVVRSDLKGDGLGTLLLAKPIAYSRARGTRRIVGAALADNQAMRALARRAGFAIVPSRDPGMVELCLELRD